LKLTSGSFGAAAATASITFSVGSNSSRHSGRPLAILPATTSLGR
jgi:hypothetical protein